jgi:hypothetical protein
VEGVVGVGLGVKVKVEVGGLVEDGAILTGIEGDFK